VKTTQFGWLMSSLMSWTLAAWALIGFLTPLEALVKSMGVAL